MEYRIYLRRIAPDRVASPPLVVHRVRVPLAHWGTHGPRMASLDAAAKVALDATRALHGQTPDEIFEQSATVCAPAAQPAELLALLQQLMVGEFKV